MLPARSGTISQAFFLLGRQHCAYSGDVNGRFQRDVNGHSGHVNKGGAQRRWDYNHARHLRD
jgi:hypothetical protein